MSRRHTFTTACAAATLAAALCLPLIASAAAPAPVEARIRQVEDVKAIERVLLEYGRSLDARDFATY